MERWSCCSLHSVSITFKPPDSPDPVVMEPCKPYLITRTVRRPLVCHYDEKKNKLLCVRSLFQKGNEK